MKTNWRKTARNNVVTIALVKINSVLMKANRRKIYFAWLNLKYDVIGHFSPLDFIEYRLTSFFSQPGLSRSPGSLKLLIRRHTISKGDKALCCAFSRSSGSSAPQNLKPEMVWISNRCGGRDPNLAPGTYLSALINFLCANQCGATLCAIRI
jgi:hypothetical protein